MSIELKKIVPYLPYKLKIWDSPDEESTEICELLSIDRNGIYELKVIDGSNIFTVNPDLWANVKPILRPLSDLFVEIKTNERFIPVLELKQIADTDYERDFIEKLEQIVKEKKIEYMPYTLLINLFEWHFDVFGLIKKKLAVDFNTIDFNKA